MSAIVVLAPVLNRPHSAARLAASLAEATSVPWHLRFLCSQGDAREISACMEIAREREQVSVRVVPWSAGPGDWAKKINLGYLETDEPYILLGASDLHFHPQWDYHVLAVAEVTGAGVIGTNDLGNPLVMRGRHSTHPLVARAYVDEFGTIDEPEKVLHEGYAHQWVDNELIETAKMRGQWAFAENSLVEHLHFMWGKSRRDSTYDKALSTSREDQRLFASRRRLWARGARPRREVAVQRSRRAGRSAS